MLEWVCEVEASAWEESIAAYAFLKAESLRTEAFEAEAGARIGRIVQFLSSLDRGIARELALEVLNRC